MTCTEARPLLDAYFDSELDLTASLSIEQHAAECAECTAELRRLAELHATLSAELFSELGTAHGNADLARLRGSIRRATAAEPRSRARWMNFALPALAAAILTAAILVPWGLNRNVRAEREIVDSHVRSLMAEHLVDVPSSNRHTVKPWFQGKIDFAPDVPDLSDRGYELVGGRLDILDGKQAAALVYRHGGHVLNLWTVRSSGLDISPSYSTLDGYQLAHWRTGSLDHWIVSDMNGEDVRGFVSLVRER